MNRRANLAWRRMPPGRCSRLVTTAHGVYSVNRFSEIMTRVEESLLARVREFRSQPLPPATLAPFTQEAMLGKTLALYSELASTSPRHH